MKAFLYKAKGAVALTLAMSMFCPQVFAAEALSAEEQGVQPAPVVELTPEALAAQETPKLTFEEALEKAKKSSPDLRAIEDTADYLKETKDLIKDMTDGSFKVPDYGYTQSVNDGWHALVTSIFNVKQGMEGNTMNREITNMKLEVSVKSFFTKIIQTQDQLELLKKNAEIQQKLYVQGQTKYRLGMLSKYNLEQLKVAAQQAKDTVALLEASQEQNYIKFNQLIGEYPDVRYELVYDLTFEPYELQGTLDNFIDNKIKNNDYAIKAQEMALEKAKFSKNYQADSNTPAGAETLEYNYDTARRDLKTAKQNKETLMRNTYLQIQQLETSYASAQADVAKAAADYRVAQVNHQAGNVTKTLVEQAEMGLISAENALKEIVYNHDMLIYTFENPTLLVDTSAMSGASAR